MISKERGESIARKNGVRFLETSAKTNVNIERAFMELSENILEKTRGIQVKYFPRLNYIYVTSKVTKLTIGTKMFGFKLLGSRYLLCLQLTHWPKIVS